MVEVAHVVEGGCGAAQGGGVLGEGCGGLAGEGLRGGSGCGGEDGAFLKRAGDGAELLLDRCGPVAGLRGGTCGGAELVGGAVLVDAEEGAGDAAASAQTRHPEEQERADDDDSDDDKEQGEEAEFD